MKYLASLIIGGVWFATYFLASHGIPVVPAIMAASLAAVMVLRKVLRAGSSAGEKGNSSALQR
jgi:uncharacterized membrane protein SpoIIM required for sporulation